MICLSLFDDLDVQCYRVLYFLIEEKIVLYPLVFNCKMFRHGKYAYMVRYGRGKQNL